jgi:SAM-dependent methyltransferase
MAAALRLEAPRGLILDAGCGDGIDLANQARREDVEIVGVDISRGGTQTSFRRTASLPNAHVVQADLRRLPFDAEQFDLSYSYGVLHHLAPPEAGLAEIVRVVKPGGRVVVYLYEDFSERSLFWRWLLAVANLPRVLTTRLPHGLLFRLCQAASPFVYLLFTVPSRIAARVPGLASMGASFPFRHGTHPFSLAGDLYDRFSAPIERRYGRQGAIGLLRGAGLEHVAIAFERGWMVTGLKP